MKFTDLPELINTYGLTTAVAVAVAWFFIKHGMKLFNAGGYFEAEVNSRTSFETTILKRIEKLEADNEALRTENTELRIKLSMLEHEIESCKLRHDSDPE